MVIMPCYFPKSLNALLLNDAANAKQLLLLLRTACEAYLYLHSCS